MHTETSPCHICISALSPYEKPLLAGIQYFFPFSTWSQLFQQVSSFSLFPFFSFFLSHPHMLSMSYCLRTRTGKWVSKFSLPKSLVFPQLWSTETQQFNLNHGCYWPVFKSWTWPNSLKLQVKVSLRYCLKLLVICGSWSQCWTAVFKFVPYSLASLLSLWKLCGEDEQSQAVSRWWGIVKGKVQMS